MDAEIEISVKRGHLSNIKLNQLKTQTLPFNKTTINFMKAHRFNRNSCSI